MYRKDLAFAAACIGMLLFGMVFLSLGTMAVYIQSEFRVDSMQIASLASSLPFGMLLGSFVFGPVADRYGYKILLIISSAFIILAFEMTAVTTHFSVLQMAYFLIGLAGGTINGATNALAADISEEAKGARLSLLGVFFGIGALGMPLLTGFLSSRYSGHAILSSLGLFVLLPLVFFSLIRFPEAKQKKGLPAKEWLGVIRQPLLIGIGLVLFFESALEGMVSNWSTTYLGSAGLHGSLALYALSTQVAAIALARLVLSRILRRISPARVAYICFGFIFTGTVVLLNCHSLVPAVIAMVFMGIGFAAGFPVMLGYTGELFPGVSGTAFSMVIALALIGNTVLNYLTGIATRTWGMHSFPVLLSLCVLLMTLIFSLVIRRINTRIKT